jgi:hypothetical protein
MADYESMRFRDLRKMVHERKLGTAAWRVTATKAQIIAAIVADDGGAPPPATPKPAAISGGAASSNGAAAAVIAKATPSSNGHADSLTELLAERLGPHIRAAVSRDEVEKIVDEKFAGMKTAVAGTPRTVVIEQLLADGTTKKKELGVQHVRFEALLRICQLRLNTYLVGPMGSGKTSAGKFVAEALGLDFAQKSVGLQTTEMDLLGYRDAHGKYVSTDLRRLYEKGGVFLLDEVDAGNPQVLVVLNSLLANGECSFPDGMIKKHKDFVLLAGANTFGLGGDRQYVGRCQLDAATLDRFVYMQWGWDASIEADMCGVAADLIWTPGCDPIVLEKPSDTKRQPLVEQYVKKCALVRRKIHDLGGAVRHSVSPRSLDFGCRLIRAGFSIDDAMDMCVWRGLDKNVRAKIS